MMTNLFDLSKFDEYNRRARIYPALLVLLPIIMGIIVLAWAGTGYFLANFARDRGKQKEPYLFKLWGGKPSTRILRHRSTSNSKMLEYTHKRLSELFSDLTLPSQREEENDPKHADELYDVCTRRMIEHTRDQKKFNLLFKENCSYGFRRNLWGLKKIGVFFAILGFLSTGIALGYTYLMLGIFSPLALITTVINIILLILWVFTITPDWVKIPAEAYAERLFASVETL